MKPQDFLLQAWRQQLDAGFRVIEAVLEGATKMHEAQLEAATDAHADAIATQKAIARAADASQLLQLQARWAASNAQKCVEYWRAMQQAWMQTQGEVVKCLSAQASIAMPVGLKGADLDASRLYQPIERIGA